MKEPISVRMARLRLPEPLEQLISRALALGSDDRKHDLLLRAWQAACRILSLVLLAHCRQHELSSEQLTAATRELSRPSFGQWLELLRATTALLQNHKDAARPVRFIIEGLASDRAAVPELEALAEAFETVDVRHIQISDKTIHGLLDAVPAYRNVSLKTDDCVTAMKRRNVGVLIVGLLALCERMRLSELDERTVDELSKDEPNLDVLAVRHPSHPWYRRLGNLAFVTVMGIELLAVGFSGYVCFRNRSLLNDNAAAVSAFQQRASRVSAGQPVPPGALVPLEQRIRTLENQDIWLPPAGMQRSLTSSYHKNGLRDGVVKALFDNMTVELQRVFKNYRSKVNWSSPREYQRNHDLLRDYLLLTVPAEDKQPPLSDDKIRNQLIDDLSKRWYDGLEVPAEGADYENLRNHVKNYVKALNGDSGLAFRREMALVEKTRLVLNRADTTWLAFEALKQEFSPPLYRDITLYDLIGNANEPWIKAAINPVTGEPYSVPAVYTRDIWDLHISKRLADQTPLIEVYPWVVGNDSFRDAERTRAAVREHYLKAYSDAWWNFHRNIYTMTPETDDQAFALVTALTAGSNTPLRMLFRRFDYNLTLSEGGLAGTSKAGATRYGHGLGNRVIQEPWSAAKVYRRMEPFVRFGALPLSQQETPLLSYLKRLISLRSALRASRSNSSKRSALLKELNESRAETRDLIDRQDVRFRFAFDNLLWPPIKGASCGLPHSRGTR